MIVTFALAAALASPPPIPKPGPDKLKHFFVSAMVHSLAFSAARGAKIERTPAQMVGGAAVVVVGVGRELHDHRVGRGASARDLVANALGALAAGALLHRTR